MSVTLWAHPQSPFCRSVSMALAIAGVEHDEKFLDLFAGAHLKPEFLKVKKVYEKYKHSLTRDFL